MTIHAKEFFICGFGRKKHHIHSEWSSNRTGERLGLFIPRKYFLPTLQP